jgi:hypothetical protein
MNFDTLISDALALEAEAAKDAHALGYMARAMVQATMPHKKAPGHEFVRANGTFTLSMLAPSVVGLPYGSVPRLLVAWITTEAVRTRSPTLELGHTLSSFMAQLGLIPTGGRWGTITRLREQMRRLFCSSVCCVYSDEAVDQILTIPIVVKAKLWWDPKSPEQTALWRSTITLGEQFYDEAVNSPVPVDMRAIKLLKRSPMALDVYCWLSYRLSYLKKPTTIPWKALQLQFGAEYARVRDFKRYFLAQLKVVQLAYPKARVEASEHGLVLRPSPVHVARLSSG